MARRTIVALYDATAQAETARAALTAAGFTAHDLEIADTGGFGAASGGGGLQPRLLGWGVPRDEADRYAEDVRRGGALLVASFGDDEAVDRAAAILRSGRPLPSGGPAEPDPRLGRAAADLSAVNTARPQPDATATTPPEHHRPEQRG